MFFRTKDMACIPGVVYQVAETFIETYWHCIIAYSRCYIPCRLSCFMCTGLHPLRFFPDSQPNFAYVYLNLPVGTDQAYTNEVMKTLEGRVNKVLD